MGHKCVKHKSHYQRCCETNLAVYRGHLRGRGLLLVCVCHCVLAEFDFFFLAALSK